MPYGSATYGPKKKKKKTKKVKSKIVKKNKSL